LSMFRAEKRRYVIDRCGKCSQGTLVLEHGLCPRLSIVPSRNIHTRHLPGLKEEPHPLLFFFQSLHILVLHLVLSGHLCHVCEVQNQRKAFEDLHAYAKRRRMEGTTHGRIKENQQSTARGRKKRKIPPKTVCKGP